MLTLDLSDVQLEYLAEGAANVVYNISPPNRSPNTAADLELESYDYGSDTPLPSEIPPLQIDPRLSGKLVRLRKNLPSAPSLEESQSYFENVIQPLFRKEDLIGSELFLVSPDLLADCNAKLLKMEKDGTRPMKRRGVYLLEDEKHGCLIMDMSWTIDDRFKCLDFKPKWLVQSPSAPHGSRRCRTCALRAMKRAKKTDPSEFFKAGFCPLNLVSHDKTKVGTFLRHILGPDPDQQTLKLRSRLIDFFFKNPLLEKLRMLQLDLDPDGVFKADLLSPKFLTAMAFRDCSLLLKVPTKGQGAIEARLGDLDLKTSSEKKAEYWRSLERVLIDEGWYTATEEDKAAHENLCHLS